MFLQSIFPPSLVLGSCFLLFLRGRQKLPEEGNKISALGHRVNYGYGDDGDDDDDDDDDDDGDDNQEDDDDDDGGQFQNEILKESDATRSCGLPHMDYMD